MTTAVHDADHVDKTNASVTLGSVMHDTAAVTGGVGAFTLPAVSFKFFTNLNCQIHPVWQIFNFFQIIFPHAVYRDIVKAANIK